MKHLAAVATVALTVGCARTDLYYPSDGKTAIDGQMPHNRAVVLNGSDSLGNTVIDVTRNGVRYSSLGGIDNSTSTREGYRTVRYGIGAAAIVAGTAVVAGAAESAYGANQAAESASNVAASKSASEIAATKGATATTIHKINAVSGIKAAEAAKALPAAGSTINAVTPALVTPVP